MSTSQPDRSQPGGQGSEGAQPGAPRPLPTLPLKSKLPTLGGTILICELLIVYLALLMGYGLRPVSLGWLITGAVVIGVLCISAAAALPRRVGQNRPGVALGWLVQLLILLAGFVMPSLFIVGALFGTMWAVAVYWGRRIDREATAWAQEEIARAGH